MSFTVTIFKKNGLAECTKFFNSQVKNESSEWEKLLNDEDLKKENVKFVIVDFVNIKKDAPLYAYKVHRCPYVDIRYDDDVEGSLAYPQKAPLVAKEIKEWTLNYIKLIRNVNDEVAVERAGTMTADQTNNNWITPTVIAAGVGVGVVAAVVYKQVQKRKKRGDIYNLHEYKVPSDNNDEQVL
jgi:hypothetical protein